MPPSTWAEVSVDGIVFLEPDLTVFRRLVRFRRYNDEGALVRHEVHGRPYGVEGG